MASRHPLDVFRSSSSGFELASRRRRTIEGKVITSRAREDEPSLDEEDPGAELPQEPLPVRSEVDASVAPEPVRQDRRGSKQQRRKKRKGAHRSAPAQQPEQAGDDRRTHPGVVPEPAAEQAPAQLQADLGDSAREPASAAPTLTTTTTLIEPEPRPLSAPPFGVERKRRLKVASQLMLYGSCLVVVALMVWIGVQHDWSGDEPLKQASAAELIDAGPGPVPGPGAAADPGQVFTIQAASYSPSEKGQLRAWEAHDALVARGYADVLVTGDQAPDASGAMRLTSCVLLVGRGAERSQLESVLASLGAIDDWPTGSASPFEDARIVSHPHPGND